MLFEVISYSIYWYFVSSWKHIGILYCTQIPKLSTVLSIPINHEHQASTVFHLKTLDDYLQFIRFSVSMVKWHGITVLCNLVLLNVIPINAVTWGCHVTLVHQTGNTDTKHSDWQKHKQGVKRETDLICLCLLAFHNHFSVGIVFIRILCLVYHLWIA